MNGVTTAQTFYIVLKDRFPIHWLQTLYFFCFFLLLLRGLAEDEEEMPLPPVCDRVIGSRMEGVGDTLFSNSVLTARLMVERWG